MKKLTLIQNELKAPKNQFNSFGKYKYRSQEDILEAVKPLLKKYECSLFITDEIKEVAGVLMVESSCVFSDGEDTKIITAQAGIDINRKGMDIAQCFGSSSSYSRKYGLSGLFLLDDTKDPDHTNDHQESKPANKTKVQEPAPELASVKQKTELLMLINNQAITQEEKDKMLPKINTLTPDQAEKSIKNMKAAIKERTAAKA